MIVGDKKTEFLSFQSKFLALTLSEDKCRNQMTEI